MTSRTRRLLLMLLCLALTAALLAGGAWAAETTEEPVGSGELEGSGEPSEEEDEGWWLWIPDEYADLLTVEMPEEDEYGTLFAVYETASIEAGQRMHPGEDWGDGWLFTIRQVTADELIELLCGYMTGEYVFAEDGEYYYLFCTPTDVRLIRDDYEYDEESMALWSEMNEWADTVPDTFLEDNPRLSPCYFGNTDAEILMFRILFRGEDYEIFYLSDGTLGSSGVDAAPYLQTLLDADFEYVFDVDRPDGEYYSLIIPEDDARIDIFRAEGNYLRVVYGDNDDFAMMFQATYPDGTEAYKILESWYKTLAALN